jgi:HAD superfamily hydrolase (TIGR01509 family)
MDPFLSAARHWVFDLDGTLTLPVHDFAAIRLALDIPEGRDILSTLSLMPPAEAAQKHAWLLEHERGLSRRAEASPGALDLVHELRERGCHMAILTRNARELALITLRTIGLADQFEQDFVLGRDEAPPKPHPGGLMRLAKQWRVLPAELVMVGDYRFDLECARAAGARSVLVNAAENPWPELTDCVATDCGALHRMLRGSRGSEC